jgi:hypothetical protein
MIALLSFMRVFIQLQFSDLIHENGCGDRTAKFSISMFNGPDRGDWGASRPLSVDNAVMKGVFGLGWAGKHVKW